MLKQLLNGIKILVIGDLMLDKYVYGSVDRMSPEAPVPVLKYENEHWTLGGAGNVVEILAMLGVDTTFVGVCGNDDYTDWISNHLKVLNVNSNIITDPSRPTTVKERLVDKRSGYQLCRIDKESTEVIDSKYVIDKLEKIPNDFNMIIISDYNKGLITKPVVDYLKNLNVKIVVDPKPNNYMLYNDVYLCSPNKSEYEQIVKLHGIQNIKNNIVVKTMGDKGMCIYDNTDNGVYEMKAEQVDISNVTGAGDTVIATISVCLSLGFGLIDSIRVANKCAGYVVTKPDTSTVPINIFLDIVQKTVLDNL